MILTSVHTLPGSCHVYVIKNDSRVPFNIAIKLVFLPYKHVSIQNNRNTIRTCRTKMFIANDCTKLVKPGEET